MAERKTIKKGLENFKNLWNRVNSGPFLVKMVAEDEGLKPSQIKLGLFIEDQGLKISDYMMAAEWPTKVINKDAELMGGKPESDTWKLEPISPSNPAYLSNIFTFS